MSTNSLSEKLKAIQQLQDKLPKLIEDDSVPEQSMDDYYVALEMRSELGNDERRRLELEEIFDGRGQQRRVEKILIRGEAGMGKSTLLNNIAYRWGKG